MYPQDGEILDAGMPVAVPANSCSNDICIANAYEYGKVPPYLQAGGCWAVG